MPTKLENPTRHECRRDLNVARIVAKHGEALRVRARRYSRSPHDAEDAYQRGLEILLRKAPSSEESDLVRWLYTVIKHEALAIQRDRRRRGADIPIHEITTAAESPTPAERAASRERTARSSDAIAHLKRSEIVCLILKARGFSYNEIATKTGWSWTKVNRSISEGRARFMARYEAIESGAECSRLEHLMGRYVRAALDEGDSAGVRIHLRHCRACRARMRTAGTRAGAITYRNGDSSDLAP